MTIASNQTCVKSSIYIYLVPCISIEKLSFQCVRVCFRLTFLLVCVRMHASSTCNQKSMDVLLWAFTFASWDNRGTQEEMCRNMLKQKIC